MELHRLQREQRVEPESALGILDRLSGLVLHPEVRKAAAEFANAGNVLARLELAIADDQIPRRNAGDVDEL